MGKYLIEFTETAIKDLLKHKASGNKASIIKIEKIIAELQEDPFNGIGQPKLLKHRLKGFWSRRINKKDRLIYLCPFECSYN